MEAAIEEDTATSFSSSKSSPIKDEELLKDYGTMHLKELITVVMVSSFMFTHPCTSITEQAVNSLSCVDGMDQCQVLIILDGYHIRDIARTKRGQITLEMR